MITILSRDGRRVATVHTDADGCPVITYYYVRCNGQWAFCREARPLVPHHAALDLAHAVIGGQ